MRSGLQELAARREALVAQSAAQRAQLAQAAEGVRRASLPSLVALDIWHLVRSQPLVAGLAVGLSVAARKRRLLAWASTALTIFSLARRIAATLRERR